MRKKIAEYAVHKDKQVNMYSALIEKFMQEAQGGMQCWTDFSSFCTEHSDCSGKEKVVEEEKSRKRGPKCTGTDVDEDGAKRRGQTPEA